VRDPSQSSAPQGKRDAWLRHLSHYPSRKIAV